MNIEHVCRAIETRWKSADNDKHEQHLHNWTGVGDELTGMSKLLIYTGNANQALLDDIHFLWEIALERRLSWSNESH